MECVILFIELVGGFCGLILYVWCDLKLSERE